MFIQFPPSNGALSQENHENITTKIPCLLLLHAFSHRRRDVGHVYFAYANPRLCQVDAQ